MKRIVLLVEGADAAGQGGEVSTWPESSSRVEPAAMPAGELRIEANLTDAQLLDVFGGLLAIPAANDFDSQVSELIRREVRRAPEDVNDLFTRIVGGVERELVACVYAASARNQSLAASRLGINRNTLHKKLIDHQLLRDGME
jgi:DNA-binding protein Fis